MIHRNSGTFGNYEETPAKHHHKNFPQNYRPAKKGMLSIKSSEDVANLQLTLAHGTDPNAPGNPALLLDTDIDEHGKLFEHLADLIKHKATGGTNPKDIHDFLSLTHPNVKQGYELVPKRRGALPK